MRKLLRFLRKFQRKYDVLVKVIIFKKRLLKNLYVLQRLKPGLGIAPVLKSNAYGHGLVEVATILDGEDIAFFVVDSYHEARVLRHNGVKSQILVIGFTPFDNLVGNGDDSPIFTLTDFEQLQSVSQNLNKLRRFHLKLDTGMNRQGIQENQLDEASALIKRNVNIKLEGICSHLADTDNGDKEFTDRQLAVWDRVSEKLKNEFKDLKYVHLVSSQGLIHLSRVQTNVARVGKALYGLSEVVPGVQPALELRAKLVGVKRIKSGDAVGYDMTFRADRDMTIGILPLGYFEGVDRRLSNLGQVKYQDKFCSILGRVSMNITVIDLTDALDPKLGDEVVVISADLQDSNSAESIAKLCGTISREIVVHIPQHLRRVVE
jgi:alanine racemase